VGHAQLPTQQPACFLVYPGFQRVIKHAIGALWTPAREHWLIARICLVLDVSEDSVSLFWAELRQHSQDLGSGISFCVVELRVVHVHLSLSKPKPDERGDVARPEQKKSGNARRVMARRIAALRERLRKLGGGSAAG